MCVKRPEAVVHQEVNTGRDRPVEQPRAERGGTLGDENAPRQHDTETATSAQQLAVALTEELVYVRVAHASLISAVRTEVLTHRVEPVTPHLKKLRQLRPRSPEGFHLGPALCLWHGA